MKDAVIYARYSSDKQDEASIEAQVRACREYAASKGYAVLEVYADEAVSGKGSKTASRKAYQKLLRDVNKGRFDTILIHKYDRVARNLGEHVNLEKKLKDRAVELIAVAQDFGSSVEAKIMKTLMWSLSEYYLDNLSNETKKGHRETAMKAKHNGGYAPFGYDVVNQEYVVNELEAGYVRKIFDAAANREGFTAIIEELAAAGITGKRGKPIKYTQIYEMLRNEKYTGTYIYTLQEERREDRRSKPNAIRIENALPPAVVADIGEQMQTIKAEIVQLQETTPPTDFTVGQIKAWLEVLKASADEKAVHLLIERIEATPGETKTDFNMQSTLKSVLGEIGASGDTELFEKPSNINGFGLSDNFFSCIAS